jgi:predicted nucleic acid-binding protein
MAVKVVDASAIAALLFGEPEADAVAADLDDADLVAPTLLGYELANVCLVKCRRHPAQREVLLAAFALRDRFGIRETAVDVDGVLSLSAEARLTVYDASYLWLARELSAELDTLDRALRRAAPKIR